MTRFWLAGALVAGVLTTGTPAAQAQQPERRTTLAEAVKIAERSNEEHQRAQAAVEVAEAERKIARGRFGPILRLEAGIQFWSEPTSITFDMPIAIPGFDIPPLAMEVQERTTMQASFTVIQPVTSMWPIYEGYRVKTLEVAAARKQTDSSSHELEEKVAQAYFQALTAERMTEIARLSVSLLEAHVKRAQALADAEIISHSKVLEAQVRLAEMKAGLFQAEGGVSLTRSNLAFQMGLPVEQEIAPAPIEDKDVATASTDIDPEEAAAGAMEARPDLAATQLRIQQAEAGERVAYAMMLPQVNLLASAQYAKGSSFQKEAAYFVGASLTWNLWEWGSTYYGIEKAQAQARQARSGLTQLREGIKLQIKKAAIDVRTAQQKLAVTRIAVQQAEENLRIIQARFEQDAESSTDVLDAQMLLAKAKTDEARASYELLNAQTALRKALGQKPTKSTTER